MKSSLDGIGPLQYFFGSVRQKPDGEIVFATLALPEGGVASVEELANLLAPYIDLPLNVTEALESDRDLNRGNVFYTWDLEDSQKLSA